MLGSDSNGNKLALRGRVAKVHKVLASGVKVAERHDIWLGNDGGYIMPRHGPIAKEMRAHFEKVRLKYDEGDVTPVYQERGTFVFDFWVKPHVKGRVTNDSFDTAHQTLAPLAEHQEKFSLGSRGRRKTSGTLGSRRRRKANGRRGDARGSGRRAAGGEGA